MEQSVFATSSGNKQALLLLGKLRWLPCGKKLQSKTALKNSLNTLDICLKHSRYTYGVSIKHYGNTIKITLKYHLYFLRHPWILEYFLKNSSNTIDTYLKEPWNMLETLFKLPFEHLGITLSTWNTHKTTIKHSSNTLNNIDLFKRNLEISFEPLKHILHMYAKFIKDIICNKEDAQYLPIISFAISCDLKHF